MTMPYKTKLKPCPFCGSHKVHIRGYGPSKGVAVECQECRCSTSACLYVKYAIKAWNRRSPDGK